MKFHQAERTAIKLAIENDVPVKELARQYNCAPSTIRNIYKVEAGVKELKTKRRKLQEAMVYDPCACLIQQVFENWIRSRRGGAPCH